MKTEATILIVDDDEEFCKTQKKILRATIQGDVHIAISYPEAKEKLSDNRYNIIICDLNLGDLTCDGYTLHKTFENVGSKSQGAFWIFVSGSTKYPDSIRGISNSVYINKNEGYEAVSRYVKLSLDSLLDRRAIDISSLKQVIEEILEKSFKDFKTSLMVSNNEVTQKFLQEMKLLKDKDTELESKVSILQKEVQPSMVVFWGWIEFLGKKQILYALGIFVLGIYALFFR